MKQLIILIALIFPFLANADVKLSPELECCVETNSKLEHQISNQGIIIKELKSIHKDLTLKNDTLIHSLKIAVEAKTEQEEKSGFDFYSLLGALLGAMISGGAAILVFYLGKKDDNKKDNKRLVDFGEQIFILIKNIIKNSEKQKELFEQYITSIKEKPHTHGKYGRISLNLFERAKSFDTTLVFNSFKQLDLDNTSYIKYYTALDYLYEFFNSVYEDYTDHNSQVVTPLSNEFLQLRQQILDKTALTLRELKEKKKTHLKFIKC